MNRQWFASLIGAIVMTGCSVAGNSIPTPALLDSAPEAPEAIGPPREIVSLSISMYLLVDDKQEPNPEISTHRTEEDLRKILVGMNEIWSQAGISFVLRNIETVEVPEDILAGMLRGDLEPFFGEIGGEIALTLPSAINGFYIRYVGGPNGINPFRSRSFFVIDEPSVFDRRVSSHEVGHILGLHHDLIDPRRLLYSGTNGMALTEDEAAVARYFVRGITRGVR